MVNKIGKFSLNFLFSLGVIFSFCACFADTLEKNSVKIAIDDDNRIRIVEWISKNPPSQPFDVVILSGFGMLTDQYHAYAEAFLSRGFRVWSFDWRGQGFSSRTTSVKTMGHIDSFETHVKDLAAVLDHIQSEQPIILFAISMGGHLAIRFLGSEHKRHDIKAAITLAPMLDINTAPYPRWIAKTLGYIMTGIGAGEQFVIGHGPFELDKFTFRPADHGDPKKFEIHKSFLKNNPEAAIGAPSYGWLRSAFESIDLIQEDTHLQKVTTPLFIVQAEHEHQVINPIQERVCKKIKNCKLVQIKDSHHSFHVETDAVWNELWNKLDKFIEGKVLN